MWGVPKQRLDGTLNTFILARLSLLISTPTARSSTCQRSACGEASVPPLLIVHRWNSFSSVKRVQQGLRRHERTPYGHVVQTPNGVFYLEEKVGMAA